MPTYEYQCDDCGHHFELFQSISEPKKTTCPECGGAIRRLLGTGAGLIFKGSGFYQTDYRSDSYKKGEKAEKKSGDAPGGEPSKKKDASGSSSKSDTTTSSSTKKD